MWDTLYFNGHLATFATTTPYGAITEAALAVEKGRISWVGKLSDLPKPPEALATNCINLAGNWLTPGLIDCHTHLVFAGNRAAEFEQLLQGTPYEAIAAAGGGIMSTVKQTRACSEDALYEQSAMRLSAMLQEGITTLEIKSGYGLACDPELKMLRVARRLGREFPVRIVTTFLGAHTIPPEFADDADGYIDLVCNEMLPRAHQKGLIDAVDVFCEHIAFSPAQTEKVFQAARALGLPVKIHAEQLSNQNGAALAASFQALSADHLEYLDEAGIKAMRDANMTAVLLPGAFYTLQASQKPPVDLLRQYKVPIAIATDCNPGSSPVHSPLTILNMACVLFRLTPEEALRGLTQNAARALGLEQAIGTLEVGKKAELARWHISEPAELCYRLGCNPCVPV